MKSVNRRVGSGGASRARGWSVGPDFVPFEAKSCPVCEALGKAAALCESTLGPCGVLEPTPLLDLSTAGVRQADAANHNPAAANSAAMARNRCLRFIVSFFLDSNSTFTFAGGIVRGFVELAFDLERRRGILVRSASEQE